MTDTLDGMLTNSDPDPQSGHAIDLAPLSTSPGIPGSEPTQVPTGVHPLDQSVPVGADGHLAETDKPPSSDGPAGAPSTRHKPWHRANEDALPVFQRAAHDWTANRYTLQATDAPVQLAGRLKGSTRTVVWVPTGSAQGVLISPDAGDVQQGAGIRIEPRRSAAQYRLRRDRVGLRDPGPGHRGTGSGPSLHEPSRRESRPQ